MSRPTPLWRAVLNDLVRRLEAGEFTTRFPTDRELMDSYQVSRHTVREAVRYLQDAGRITRHPGRGSTVQKGAFVQPLGTVYSLFESIEAAGAVQDSRVLAQGMRTDRVAAATLGLPAGAELFYLERIRNASGEPLAHDRVWLPGSVGRPLLDVDFSHTALYAELRTHCGLGPEEGDERISPAVPEARYARFLGLEPGKPVLAIERRTAALGEPLEWRITLVRGDRYSFRAEWRAEDTVVVPRLTARR